MNDTIEKSDRCLAGEEFRANTDENSLLNCNCISMKSNAKKSIFYTP